MVVSTFYHEIIDLSTAIVMQLFLRIPLNDIIPFMQFFIMRNIPTM